jgi:hypothetical protein
MWLGWYSFSFCVLAFQAVFEYIFHACKYIFSVTCCVQLYCNSDKCIVQDSHTTQHVPECSIIGIFLNPWYFFQLQRYSKTLTCLIVENIVEFALYHRVTSRWSRFLGNLDHPSPQTRWRDNYTMHHHTVHWVIFQISHNWQPILFHFVATHP